MAPAWCRALARPTALYAAMLPVTPRVTRLPASTRTVAAEWAICLDVALVVEPQPFEGQHRIVDVDDARLSQHCIGQPAGGDHQRIVSQFLLDAGDQPLDQSDVAIDP